jgi:hypothetical protein
MLDFENPFNLQMLCVFLTSRENDSSQRHRLALKALKCGKSDSSDSCYVEYTYGRLMGSKSVLNKTTSRDVSRQKGLVLALWNKTNEFLGVS